MLKICKITDNATIPTRSSSGSAGYDLYAAYDYTIVSRGKVLIKTDLQIEIPEGCYGRIAPRSGLAVNHFIDVGAGVIDRDYRGNVCVLLFNFGEEYIVHKGDRVAQLICEKILIPFIAEYKILEETNRGEEGFGSSGK
jgi:dUTP pyrophosphatase